MNIRELRLSKGLTQAEAAKLIGMELRTYQNYESGKSKRDLLKINYIINTLRDYERVTETKGILSVEEITIIVTQVCREHEVSYVYLFGSYAKNIAREDSDIDLLIECKETGLAFIGIMEELHIVLKKNVDLIKINDISENFEFLNEVLKTGIKVYG